MPLKRRGGSRRRRGGTRRRVTAKRVRNVRRKRLVSRRRRINVVKKKLNNTVSITTYWAADDPSTEDAEYTVHQPGRYDSNITPEVSPTTGNLTVNLRQEALSVNDPKVLGHSHTLKPFLTEPPLDSDHDGCIVENLNHVPWDNRPSGTMQQSFVDVVFDSFPDFYSGAVIDKKYEGYRVLTMAAQSGEWSPLYWCPNVGLRKDDQPHFGQDNFTGKPTNPYNPDGEYPNCAYPRGAGAGKTLPKSNMYDLHRGYPIYTLDATNQYWRPGITDTNVNTIGETKANLKVFPDPSDTEKAKGVCYKRAHLPVVSVKGIPESASGSLGGKYEVPNTVFGGVNINLTFRNYHVARQVIEVKVVRCKNPLPYNVQMQTGTFTAKGVIGSTGQSLGDYDQQSEAAMYDPNVLKSTPLPPTKNPNNDLFRSMANGKYIDPNYFDVVWSTSKVLPSRKPGIAPVSFNCKKKLTLNYKRNNYRMRDPYADYDDDSSHATAGMNIKPSYERNDLEIENNCFLVINYRAVQANAYDFDERWELSSTSTLPPDQKVTQEVWSVVSMPSIRLVKDDDPQGSGLNRISIVGTTSKWYHCRDLMNPSQQALHAIAAQATMMTENEDGVKEFTASNISSEHVTSVVSQKANEKIGVHSGKNLSWVNSKLVDLHTTLDTINKQTADIQSFMDVDHPHTMVDLKDTTWVSADGTSTMTFSAPTSSMFNSSLLISGDSTQYDVTVRPDCVRLSHIDVHGNVSTITWVLGADQNSLISPSGKIYSKV